MGGEQLPAPDPIARAGRVAVIILLGIFVAIGLALVGGLCWRIFQAVAFASG